MLWLRLAMDSCRLHKHGLNWMMKKREKNKYHTCSWAGIILPQYKSNGSAEFHWMLMMMLMSAKVKQMQLFKDRWWRGRWWSYWWKININLQNHLCRSKWQRCPECMCMCICVDLFYVYMVYVYVCCVCVCGHTQGKELAPLNSTEGLKERKRVEEGKECVR